jgi:hypothetical protein
MSLVGDGASSLERLMVESRVVVRNAAGVHGHVRLAVDLDRSSSSLHRPQELRLDDLDDPARPPSERTR